MKRFKLLIISFLIQSMGMLGNVLTRITFGNLLSETEFGIYNLVILMPNMIALVVNLGLGHAISLRISKSEFIEKNLLKFIYGYGLIIGFIASFIGFFVFSFVYQDIPIYLVLLACFLTIIYLLNYLLSYVFLGLQQSYKYFLSTNLIHILAPVLFLVLIIYFDASVNISVAAYSFSLIVVNLYLNLSLYFLNDSNYKENTTKIKELSKELPLNGLPFYSTTLLNFLNYRIDYFIIGFMLPYNSLSSYSIAFLFVDSFGRITQILSILVFQKIPKIKNISKRNEVTNKVLTLNTILNFGAIVLLIFFSDTIIQFIFPRKFEDSYEIIMILLPGMFFLSVFRILYHRMAADGFGKYGAFSSGLSLIITILLNVILIPKFGITGAAVTSTIAYFIMYVFIHRSYHKMVNGNLNYKE